MRKNKKPLTLLERWEIDNDSLAKSGGWISKSPQCKICEYRIIGNAENCNQYQLPEEIPDFVAFPKKECLRFKHKDILQIFPKTKYEEQFLGGIFGFCTGDALGVPLEFTTREERKKDPVQEMRAYGTHHQYWGTWSDDTSMTLCLIESLKKGYDLKNLANNYCKFYYDGYWTPDNKVFDIGNTTVRAIERMKIGINPNECGGSSENDNGNGSLMRVLPLAFYLRGKDSVEKIKIIEEISSLTHAHKRSKLACIMYVEFAINLLNTPDKLDAYKKTVEFINNYCTNDYLDELSKFNRILNNDWALADENDIRSSGYVIDSLEASLWAFMTADDYQSSIFKAINLGGDTDTIAAMTGGLSGIFYGIKAIPENWIQCLARKNDINKLVMDFGIAIC